jgi:hypothetical protein
MAAAAMMGLSNSLYFSSQDREDVICSDGLLMSQEFSDYRVIPSQGTVGLRRFVAPLHDVLNRRR